MSNKLKKPSRGIGGTGIAGNSVSVLDGDFISKVGGYAVASTTGDILGVAAGEQTFASDNETVAKAKLVYIAMEAQSEVDCDIAGGTVTQADEGVSMYNLTDKDTVNGTTESSTTGQLLLVKFISSTLGRFRVVNK